MWSWLGSLLWRIFGSPEARARLLRIVVEDAAALVVALNPTASWAQLLENVVKMVLGSKTPPTTNQAAIERAAAAALIKLGKTTSGSS